MSGQNSLIRLSARLLVTFILLPQAFLLHSQVYLSEGFELGAKPDGWTEESVTGTEPWRFRNGGHSPNDNNWHVPAWQTDITRNPPAAYDGTYNAIFFKQGDGNERTKLITPPMNLLGGAAVELSFYLCQIPWNFEGSTGWDILRVYYKVSESAPWVLLHAFLDPVYSWELQTLVLPNPSATYYLAFEGQTRWGFGTCIDNITVQSTGLQPMWIREIDARQPFTRFVASGTPDVPVMRVDFTVQGNSDTARLRSIRFNSLNTSDSDIVPGGVKLYSTTSQIFSTENQLGTPVSFTGGVAEFNGLNHILPPGNSYVWLTYDLKYDIEYGHNLDAKLAANSILANDTLYPSAEMSPAGARTVYSTQYYQGFEGAHGWTLTGEFEVGQPSGQGGDPGNPDPSSAFRGVNSLGTDLTSLGIYPYRYEPDISESSSYHATSPALDLYYYKNLSLFFQRQLNIEVWDHASVEVSIDNGVTWHPVWESSSYLNDYRWSEQHITIPDDFSRTNNLMFRFTMGPTDGQNNYSGWNIDDVYLTGEFITRDVGVSEWIYPLNGSGHTSSDSVTVRITNFGGAPVTDPVPVAYSFDGGLTWVTNTMNDDIPVGGSALFTFLTKADLSAPGLRPSVLAKTIFPNDQFAGNDQIATEVYIIPTYVPPYLETFEAGDGYWRPSGNPLWEYGVPAGNTIDNASSGTKSWVTGLTSTYGDLITRANAIIFQDDFESDRGWTYTGEFERNAPDYVYLPYFAYSGYYCIGTDLSGSGSLPFQYENGITPATQYTATSPSFDVSSYSNLRVDCQSWITIQGGDSVRFQASSDNGASWVTLWKNTGGAITDSEFTYRHFEIPDSLTSSGLFRFRFSLFHSSAAGTTAQGWSIDNVTLYGDLVSDSEAFLNSPSYDLSGLEHPVLEARLRVDTEEGADGATLLYSVDDGHNWTSLSNSSGFDAYWNWYSGRYVSSPGTDGWSGQSGSWMTVRHLLPSTLAGRSNVQFRFKFMADKFNNQYDGVAIDDARVYEAPYDVSVVDIVSPFTACELAPDQRFTLRIRNTGVGAMSAGDSIKIGYHIEKSGVTEQTEEMIFLSQPLAAGETRDFSMTRQFDYSASGDYLTTVYSIEPDPYFYRAVSNDTVQKLIQVHKPLVELGDDLSTVRPDTVTLRAYSGTPGQDYLWQDNSTDSLFNVSSQGKYYVRVTNSYGCTASDTIMITALIADVGISRLAAPNSACELSSGTPVIAEITNFGTDTVDVGDTVFVYREINNLLLLDTLLVPARIFPGASVSYTFSQTADLALPGVYDLRLYTRYQDDTHPLNDTLDYNLEVYGYPPVDLGADQILTATEYLLAAPPGYYSYLWQDGSSSDNFVVTEPGSRQYFVSVADEHGCSSSDTVNILLNVTDTRIAGILSPATSCGLSDNITVSMRLKNTGNITVGAGTIISTGYRVDSGTDIIEPHTLSSDFLPGDSLDITFVQKTAVVGGQWYDFTVFASFPGDMKPENDTILMPVGIFATPVVDLGEDYQVIHGFEYTLDAGPGFTSYLWQDGSTGRTYTVNTPGINACSVTVTDSNGCTGHDAVQVMIAVPDIGIAEIIHPVTTCSLGNDEHIRVAIRNTGNWDIDPGTAINVSYSVNGRPAVSDVITLAVLFEHGTVIEHIFTQGEDFSIPDRYTISVSMVYAADLIPSNDALTVDTDVLGSPIVNIGAGQDTILSLSPVVLSATPGYSSYIWQDGSNTADFTVGSPGRGMYSVAVTGDNGCVTHDSVYVVYDFPDISVTSIKSPVSSCALPGNSPVSIEIRNNGFYHIASGSVMAVSYDVNGGTPANQNITLPGQLMPDSSLTLAFTALYDFSAPGSYNLNVSVTWDPDLNLLNNTLGNSVSVWGLPVVDIGQGMDTLRIPALPVTLDAGPGFTSYLWHDNSVSRTFSAAQWGRCWVTVTDPHGCSASDTVVVRSSVGIEDLNAFPGTIKIFPNPVADILHITAIPGKAENIRIELYNPVYQLLWQDEAGETTHLYREFNVQKLMPGLYILRITVGERSFASKIIVARD
jgi:hypothetical protein